MIRCSHVDCEIRNEHAGKSYFVIKINIKLRKTCKTNVFGDINKCDGPTDR